MKIVLNDESFRYDVHSLIKAFYPEETLNYDIISKKNARGNLPEIIPKDPIEILIPSDFAGDRTTAKNIFKRELYEILSARTGKVLPWGTLTGIRPVKITSKLLREGKSKEEVLRYLKETYLISENKGKLITSLGEKENEILSGININKTASLYIGIPFCPSICAYCSFSSYPIDKYEDRIEAYILSLKKELEFVAENTNKEIVSIYMGGGTPSTLSPKQLEDLIGFIKDKFNLSMLKEFSVECGRPDSITREKLYVLHKMDVDRICVNPQTMNDKTLDIIGRKHKTEDTLNAFYLAMESGIPIINCDLIAGLPGEDEKEVKNTLNKISELSPNNLTIHSLAIKRAARLNHDKKGIKPEKLSEEIFSMFVDTAENIGLKPYYLYRQKQISGNLENIGFAKEGLECIYNCLIMGECQDIIACGAGAISKFIGNGKPTRVVNVKDVDLYIKRIDEMIERKSEWL